MKLKDEREIFFFVKIHSGFLLSVCVCVCAMATVGSWNGTRMREGERERERASSDNLQSTCAQANKGLSI